MRKLYGVPRIFFGLVPGRLTFLIGGDGRIHDIVGHQFRLAAHVRKTREAVERLVAVAPQLARR